MSRYCRTVNENEPVRGGRPRSEAARAAVLHAADDLVVELGYAAVTMKAIAERAGVSRMTVYRWWSTKAEVLFEASVHDARAELALRPSGDEQHDLTVFLAALIGFLSRSDAGIAYRALIGEAQHDEAEREGGRAEREQRAQRDAHVLDRAAVITGRNHGGKE